MLAKARFLAVPPQAFQLIETLRLEAGIYFLPDRHVARMLESAAFFEFVLDEAAVRTALEAIRVEHLQGAWKVRLLVSSRGEIHSEASPLIGPKDQVWRVGLATAPLDSADRFLFHKTTHRSYYEQPFGSVPIATISSFGTSVAK